MLIFFSVKARYWILLKNAIAQRINNLTANQTQKANVISMKSCFAIR